MNPAPFAYQRAATLEEAFSLLAKHGDEGKVLAGGHSLLPAMKLRLAEPGQLIDISRIHELKGVRRDGDVLVIGALTTHRELEQNHLVREFCPVLAETAGKIGDVQVRNRGTIGGALAHADPAADYPAPILALAAELVARGASGSRTIAATDFFQGIFTTALAPEELLTEIRFDLAHASGGSSYQKLANQASGYAIVGVAAIVDLDAAGAANRVSVGITGAGAVPVLATAVSEALTGSSMTAESITRAAELAGEGIDWLEDLQASSEYRRRITIGQIGRAHV